MTDFANYDGAMRFQRILRGTGIEEALREAGVRHGDLVRIGPAELYWEEPAEKSRGARSGEEAEEGAE